MRVRRHVSLARAHNARRAFASRTEHGAPSFAFTSPTTRARERALRRVRAMAYRLAT